MPTENRSSNTEHMVSARVFAYTPGQSRVELQLIPPSPLPSWLEPGQAVTVRPAKQHQGEPVAWLNTATGNVTTSFVVVMDRDDEKEHVQSLYTQADSEEAERGPWQPLTAPGQIQLDDWLSFTVAGKFMCAQAREILNLGTSAEEIIYNRRQNHYFVTSMAIDGSSAHKGVLVAKANRKL